MRLLRAVTPNLMNRFQYGISVVNLLIRWRGWGLVSVSLGMGLLDCSNSRSVVGGPASQPSAIGAPCGYDGACPSSPDRPLVCDRGFCVPRRCIAGTEGCACYANNTCDLLDASPMSCLDNLCRRTPAAEPGALNGACSPTELCGMSEGRSLSCIRGRCERDDCPSGALGCPCGSYGSCRLYGTRQPVCASGRCQFAGCVAGTDGCRCDTGDRCSDGLQCTNSACIRLPGSPLAVEGDVRSCQVLLSGGGVDRASPTWAAGVRGQAIGRDGQLALAFMNRTDTRLSASPVRLGGLATGLMPSIQSFECFDGLGRRVADARVVWGR